ncbi:AAA family ATPase [Ohtaekwangia koreensis]|uniref:Predicted kinase n=1 Tax=Ohtaekwangia koreensis TaxID=688867 RepID=A0A1T5JEC2_9BACT|nr:AAA family ATPase [Ohtaekwangia koreensis]SKC49947.1 Predicted kinase [Ohtaekwangia koreensis]
MNWSLSKNKEWSHLEQQFDWVAAMRDVPQDSLYHAEGNVSVHTQMVLQALTTDTAFQKLTEEERELLWTAALLHDVEKRSTTVTEVNGRISSHGHARKGELTARRVLYEHGIPFKEREYIAALVRYHGLPLWIMEKRNSVKSLLEASLRTDMKLLSLLARADVRGRVCADQRKLLDRVDFFDAYCEEQSCWHEPRVFATDNAKFTYFHKEDAHPDYIPFDDLRSTVVMLCGLPGMGKDLYIKKHYSNLPMLSLDAIRRAHKLKPDDASATGWAVQLAKEQAREFLRKGESFVWNATNITRQMRTQWIDLFVAYKARIKLIYIEVPYHEWLKQNNDREYAVPQSAMFRLLQKLEVPSIYEAHEVVYHV